MMVEVCMSCDKEKSKDFNKEVTATNNDTVDTAVLDPAVIAIDNEDVMFKDNVDLLDMTGNQVDLDLIEQYNQVQLLGRNTQIDERSWSILCNMEKHFGLQTKVMNHVSKHVNND